MWLRGCCRPFLHTNQLLINGKMTIKANVPMNMQPFEKKQVKLIKQIMKVTDESLDSFSWIRAAGGKPEWLKVRLCCKSLFLCLQGSGQSRICMFVSLTPWLNRWLNCITLLKTYSGHEFQSKYRSSSLFERLYTPSPSCLCETLNFSTAQPVW